MNKVHYLFCFVAFVLMVTVFSLGVGLFNKPNLASFRCVEEENMLLPTPQWSSYACLPEEARRFWQGFNWQVKKPGEEGPLFLENREKAGALSTQQERMAFKIELAEREALLEETVKRRQKQIELELEGRVKQKQNQDLHLIKVATEKKRKEQTLELADFQRKNEEDYSLKLVGLHFKTKIPDLAPEERSLLAKEISELEQELKTKISEKSDQLEKELQLFAQQRREAVTEELENYRQRLKQKAETRFLQEKQKLEQEFFEWKQKSESELGFY